MLKLEIKYNSVRIQSFKLQKSPGILLEFHLTLRMDFSIIGISNKFHLYFYRSLIKYSIVYKIFIFGHFLKYQKQKKTLAMPDKIQGNCLVIIFI